ncbi:MAG TPA: hypothetical protein VI279_05015 [Rhodocyclaceae bacterium]
MGISLKRLDFNIGRKKNNAMTNLVKFSALLFMLIAGGASANTEDEICTDDIRAIVSREMKIEALVPRRQDGNIVSESCKSWPYNKNMMLSAFAYDAGVEYEKTLVVAMIDMKTKRIVSRYQTIISEDAVTEVGEYSLRLDTARYQLAKGVRAFGLRFNNSARGASCGEANWNDELTLLVPEGKQLRPVLSLHMYKQQSIQGCLSVQDPTAIWRDANLTISVEKSSTKGFYDLLATATITHSSNGESLENLKDHEEQHVFRYNGKIYEKSNSAPWWISFW